MLQIILTILQGLWTILKWFLIPAGVVFAVIGVRVSFSVFLAWHKGERRPAGEHHNVKSPGLLKKVFILFPRQFARDFFSRPADWFRYQGVIVFTGRQGSGKTVALVEQTLRMQHEYPSCKRIGNLAYEHEDDELTDWRQLIEYKNGHRGVIVQMDEMQNWFSSNQSKNFPPELLEVITQNRKNRRVILGTSQSFNRLAKPLREQTTEVRRCLTIAGCLTVVHRVEPELNSQGEVEKWKHRGFYWFVHTPEIRDSYDTYHVIESLAKSGFSDRTPDTNVTIFASAGKR
nr:hypothetical protein [uncultured Dysosmobacter sp.]